VLYDRDPRFAHFFIAVLKREGGLIVGDNEPYSVTDASDYTIPVHGERRGLHHVAIEVRQGPDRRRQGPACVGSAARTLAGAGVSGTGGGRGT
jgi:predicted N-formylglutamate amidohydrolase